jgi:hypothetical protein
VLEGVADGGGEVDGVGVSGWVELLRVGCRLKQEGEEKGRDYSCSVFYRCSPELTNIFGKIDLCWRTRFNALTQPPSDWTFVTVNYTLGHRRW